MATPLSFGSFNASLNLVEKQIQGLAPKKNGTLNDLLKSRRELLSLDFTTVEKTFALARENFDKSQVGTSEIKIDQLKILRASYSHEYSKSILALTKKEDKGNFPLNIGKPPQSDDEKECKNSSRPFIKTSDDSKKSEDEIVKEPTMKTSDDSKKSYDEIVRDRRRKYFSDNLF